MYFGCISGSAVAIGGPSQLCDQNCLYVQYYITIRLFLLMNFSIRVPQKGVRLLPDNKRTELTVKTPGESWRGPAEAGQFACITG